MVISPGTLLFQNTIEQDSFVRCSVNALLESAVYGIALLSCASPRECAGEWRVNISHWGWIFSLPEFIGAVSTGPNPLFVQTIVAGCFSKAEYVYTLMHQLGQHFSLISQRSLTISDRGKIVVKQDTVKSTPSAVMLIEINTIQQNTILVLQERTNHDQWSDARSYWSHSMLALPF